MLLIVFTASFLIALLMTSNDGLNAIKGLYGGQVKGESTSKYWSVSDQVCSEFSSSSKFAKIGDSISVGFPAGNYMPDALNLAEGGATSKDFAPGGKLNSKLNGLNNSGVDYAVIMLGTNDCSYAAVGQSGFSPNDVYLNLQQIVRKVKSYGVTPIISTFPRRGASFEQQCGNEAEYNSLIRQLARVENIPLRDIEQASLDGMIPLDPDKLHLSSEANENINQIMEGFCSDPLEISGGTSTYTGSSSSGSGGEGNICDVLGLESGVVEAYVQDHSEYYDVDLGVVGTVVCPGTPVDQIVDIARNSSPANNIHVVRLGHGGCVFSEADAIKKISEIRSKTSDADSPKVYILIGNEPRTDWASLFPDDCNGGGDCTAGTNAGQYTANIVNGVQHSGLSGTSDTSEFLLFPAFNYHVAGSDTDKYVSNFFAGYKSVADVDLSGDFAGFGVSMQKESASESFSSRIDKYKAILEAQGVGDYKLHLFGANTVNYEADQGFIDDLLGAIRENEDTMEGVYIFSPWGWDYAPGSGIRNLPIPMPIWNKIFEECQSESTYSCLLSPVADVPGLANCNVPKKSQIVARIKLKKDGEVRTALPILTQQVDMTLLGWMGDENSLNRVADPDYEGPSYGTEINPFLAPCAADKLTNPEEALLDKQFSGPIRLIYNEKERDIIDYQINLLGNAMACMIWDARDMTAGSMSITELEPRFKLDEGESIGDGNTGSGYQKGSIEILQSSAEDVANLINQLSSKIAKTDNQCSSSIYTRVEPSDKLSGAELIVEDGTYDFSDDNVLCDAMAIGSINVIDAAGNIISPEQSVALYCRGAAGSRQYIGPEDALYYNYVKNGVEKIEIPGAAEGLAQLWVDEAIANPWGGTYEVKHNDKAAIEVSYTQKLYDGWSTESTDFGDPITSDEESCTLKEYSGDKAMAKGNAPKGSADFVIPWMGQSLSMMKRMHGIFYVFKEEERPEGFETAAGYLDKRHDEIEELKELKGSNGLIPFNKYRDVIVKLFNPDNIFLCSDITGDDGLLPLIYDIDKNEEDDVAKKMAETLEKTDCLGRKGKAIDKDPLKRWLCQEGHLDSQYCIEEDQCKSIDDLNRGNDGSLTGMVCPIKTPVGCAQGVDGTYSHMADGMTAQELVNRERIALDLDPAGSDTMVYAPEDIRTIAPAQEAFSDTLTGSCGVHVILESIATPGLRYSIYHLHTDPSKNNPNIYIEGETIQKGDLLGELLPGQPGDNACTNGAHLHISANYNGTIAVDPYLLLEDACGEIVCEDEDKSVLQDGNLVIRPDELNTDYSNLIDEDALCKTEDGKDGYRSDRISAEAAEGTRPEFEYGNLSELQQNVLNACPVELPECDERCKETTKAWVVRLAQENIEQLGRDYNENDYYSIEEVRGFMDDMYEEAHDDIKFQLLIAIWLSENGLNPTFKNKGFESDIFGCGVFCSEPPKSFEEELACVTRKLQGCSVMYAFDEQKPGEYLEKYGPIEDNPTFTTKVFMIMDKLAEVQGDGSYRNQSGNCSMYVYDEIPPDLDWAVGLLDRT